MRKMWHLAAKGMDRVLNLPANCALMTPSIVTQNHLTVYNFLFAQGEIFMQDAIKFFKDALSSEVKAAALYELAAETTQDDESRMLFLKLVDMEEGHARVLANKVKNAPCGQEFDVDAYMKELESQVTPTLSDEERDIITKGTVHQVLEMAIDHELKARDTYQNLADEAVDPDVKSYCLEMVEEEQGHATSLRNLLTSLDMSPEDRPGL